MTNFEHFNIPQLAARNETADVYGEALVYVKAGREGTHIPMNIPLDIDYVHFCLFTEGSGVLNVNGHDVELQARDLLICSPNSIIEVKAFEDEFCKHTLALASRFVHGNCYLGAKLENILAVMRIQNVYKLSLTEEECNVVLAHLDYLQRLLRQEHPYQEQRLQNECYNIVLEVAPAFNRDGKLSGGLTRQAIIMRDFYDLALRHFRQEHFLGFYASQLCISEQYLSLVVRETAGRSVADILSTLLILEAERMLIDSRRPIKFIADALSFRDTTNFCSYFKNKTGLSPTEYRKKHQ